MDHVKRAWGELIERLVTSEPPGEALEAAGRLVADSVICGLAAAPFERSRLFRKLCMEMGGAGEARVVGTADRLPTPQAAAVNAEAMNLLDADDTFLNVAHFGALVSAVALAEAERTGADWTALRRAVVLGFDLDARVTLAHTARPSCFAPGLMAPGAALAAVALSTRDPEMAGQALGLALRSAPTPVSRAISLLEPSSWKYAPFATLAREAVLAARLALEGYRSSPDFMVDDPGFFQVQQAQTINWARLFRPREDGWVQWTSLKPYPSFRIGHPALDALKAALAGQDFAPGTVETVEVQLDPRALRLPFHHWPYPDPDAGASLPVLTAMNLKLSLALTLLRVPAGPRWSAREVLDDPVLRALHGRIRLSPEPLTSLASLDAQRSAETGLVHDARSRVTVIAAGRSFTAEVKTCDGDPWRQETRPDWAWLERKAVDFLGSAEVVERFAAAPADLPVGDLPLALA